MAGGNVLVVVRHLLQEFYILWGEAKFGLPRSFRRSLQSLCDQHWLDRRYFLPTKRWKFRRMARVNEIFVFTQSSSTQLRSRPVRLDWRVPEHYWLLEEFLALSWRILEEDATSNGESKSVFIFDWRWLWVGRSLRISGRPPLLLVIILSMLFLPGARKVLSLQLTEGALFLEDWLKVLRLHHPKGLHWMRSDERISRVDAFHSWILRILIIHFQIHGKGVLYICGRLERTRHEPLVAVSSLCYFQLS